MKLLYVSLYVLCMVGTVHVLCNSYTHTCTHLWVYVCTVCSGVDEVHAVPMELMQADHERNHSKEESDGQGSSLVRGPIMTVSNPRHKSGSLLSISL